MINPELKKTINALKAASRKSGDAIWRALADELDKPKRRRTTVNLSRINRHSDAGDIVAVPGKVLAAGSLTHPVTIASYSFSEGAREKVTRAEGRIISLIELMDEGIEPSKIRILK